MHCASTTPKTYYKPRGIVNPVETQCIASLQNQQNKNNRTSTKYVSTNCVSTKK